VISAGIARNVVLALVALASLTTARAPDVAFGWFDAPRSLNRLPGVQWLASMLYPDLFPEPLAPRVKAFHTRFHHREPTDSQVRALLEGAGSPR
jgi:iron complex transport system substrate-binding protein